MKLIGPVGNILCWTNHLCTLSNG